MNSVTLNAEGGRTLRLTRTDELDSHHGSGFDARLTVPEGAVETNVYEYREGLAEHFADPAANWRGWEGVKEYASLEGQLRQPWPPDWSFEAELEFGAQGGDGWTWRVGSNGSVRG